MNPSPFRDLDRILRILKETGLPHALIGGWAIISWGVIRASEDLDMLIDLPVSRRRDLLAALAVDYEAEWREGGEDDPVPGMIRARPRAPDGFPVDFLIARGKADRAALANALVISTDGIAIPIVRPEELMAMKLEAGGGQDYEDVRRLLQVLAGTVDEPLLRQSCRDRKVLDRLELLRGK